MKRVIYSVEDDKDISTIIRLALVSAGYEVYSFLDGESFLDAFNNKKPDLVLLDMMLPKISGEEILKYIRNNKLNNDIDIIIISANKLLNDKVTGLSLGADDYIEKPFEILELISRVNARFRKSKSRILMLHGFEIDEDKRKVTKNDKEYVLTNTEFDLLVLLIKNNGKCLSRDEIMEELWGENSNYESRTIDMHIRNIRKKLNDDSIILTLHGHGYRVDE